MSEYTDYYVIHAPSLDELKAKLLANNIRAVIVRFLFSDRGWGGYGEAGDEELLIASQTPTPEQLALLKELFGVPRAELLPYLSMDGVNMDGLTGFAKLTGIPLHILTNQMMMELNERIPEGRTVIFLDDFLD